MPFDLKNTTQTFQWLMDSVLHDFPFLSEYFDDILVASAYVKEHLSCLRLLFSLVTTE